MTSLYPFKTLDDLGSIAGTTGILRSELNAPQSQGRITDATRLERALVTLNELVDRGAKVVVLAHASSAQKGEVLSLTPIAEWISDRIECTFIPALAENELAEAIKNAPPSVVLLENIRNWEGEESNNPTFSKFLSTLGSWYVNDAFPVSHRKHASIVGIPQYLPSYAGRQFELEYKNLSKVLRPEHPFVFILGGAKSETKLPLALALRDRADTICIGGALINVILKQQGYSIGSSYVPDPHLVPDMTDLSQSKTFLFPNDLIVEEHGVSKTVSVSSVPHEAIISDIGPETVRELIQKIQTAKFVVWNGPLGNVEKGYTDATTLIAEALRRSSAETIVGGGDSLAFINTEGIGFVSTAGGAMLDFLTHGTLPGITALEQ